MPDTQVRTATTEKTKTSNKLAGNTTWEGSVSICAIVKGDI